MPNALLLAIVLTATAPPRHSVPPWDDVVERYTGVHDYTCLYVKEELAVDHGEPQTIRLSFRKPFDVRMEWLNDRGAVDQVAVYRRGMNDGKVIARRHGMLGSLAGTLRLNPTDRMALQDSRHPITEVGFGPLVDGVARALREGSARISGVFEGTDGTRLELEVTAGTRLLDVSGARRIRIVIGPAAGLPVTVEIFDAAGARLERHRFSEIRVNVGLSDAVFTL